MWKEIMRWCMPRGGWLLAAVAFVVAAGVATPLVAQAATVNVWNLGAEVTDLRIGPSDEVWTMAGGKPRMLDPGTNEVTTYSHPLAGTGVLAVDGAGMVWSPDSFSTAEGTLYVISRLNPTTLEVTSWLTETSAGSIAVDGSGNVWWAKGAGLWRLVPGTNTITKWTLPLTSVSLASRQPFDPSGRVWMRYTGGVAVLDPSTSYLTYWAAPSGEWRYPFAHTDGNAWFPVVYSGVDSIARLDPSTNQVTEWPCRTGCDGLTAVRLDSLGKVWFTEDAVVLEGGGVFGTWGPDYVGWLDPTDSPPAFTEWPITCADVTGASCGSYPPRTLPRWLQFDSTGNVWVYFAESEYSLNYRVAKLAP